jgi:hypothetical protein
MVGRLIKILAKTLSSTAIVAAVLVFASVARASLTTSESEQVRGYVASADHADRVRALVARPDLTSDESAAAMASALSGLSLDERHAAYLADLVRGAPAQATRPVLAVAIARGLLARADTLYAAHPIDLDRSAAVLAELGLAYDFAATFVSGDGTSMTDAARADIGKALLDHVARTASLLRLEVPVSLAVARLRAQLATTIVESLPDGPTRKVDAADRLGLTGARRAALIEAGLLVMDRTGADGPITQARMALDRLPQARDGVVALFIGDEHATLRARGAVVTVPEVSGPLGEAGSPWGAEADPPRIAWLTEAVTNGIATNVVSHAAGQRPGLRIQIEHDGGLQGGVATVTAMLVLDAQRTLDVAAARLLAGRKETAAWLSDALGALAVFAPAGDARAGLTLTLGASQVTHVVLDPAGAASAFRFGNHVWRIERDASGAVAAFKRDGAPVAISMLPTARVAATEGDSWSGAGLVLARLSGTPRVAISAGPRVRVVGSSVSDAVLTPAPGDELTLDADVHLDGGPAGIVLHALPGRPAFRGVSLLLMAGATPHAVLMAADGTGDETAESPVVDVPSSSPAAPWMHVHVVLKPKQLTATVGPASAPVTLSLALPDELSHGDVGLRAYPGATLQVSGLQITGAKKR